MPGAGSNLSPTYGYDGIIGEMWEASDLVECLIFIALVLMLGYTAFVVIRFSCRYNLGRRKFCALVRGSIGANQIGHKTLVAELSRGVKTLKSIAATAPFLGLAGTCYGILVVFSTGYVGSKSRFLALILLEVATTLTATVAGLIVAIPAAVSYNVLRTRLEKYETSRANTMLEAHRSYGFAQTLPLRRRFSGFPPFALIGAPVLGILVPMFALMLRSAIPVGLPVYVTKIGIGD